MADKIELPLIKHTENLLKNNEKFADKDGKLFVTKILESIEQIDLELVQILVNDSTTKKHFFTSTKDFCILNQNKFIEFFTMNEYFEHSFTSYKNKIGLIKKDSFVKKFDDVVLAFPYKDCLLEGGQTKDDDKNSEVFYNSVISADEIDRLLEPKVLSNIKKFDKDGEHSVEEIKEDDNLIIKGNNLLALHSLKERYRGKVKLIYIDPPYNTGNDSFNYNDNFNHSTWLTFMKNRLEVAKDFLSDDGVIFINIDENEQAYLKILLDEIFGRDNFIGDIIRKTKSMTADKNTGFNLQHEYLIIFSKNKQYLKLKGEEKDFKNYKNLDNDINGDWVSGDPSAKSGSKTTYFEIKNPITGQSDYPPSGRYWAFSQDSLEKYIKDGKIKFKTQQINNERGFIFKRYKNDASSIYNPVNSLFAIENEFMNQVGTKELYKLFKQDIFDNPKPVNFIRKLIEYVVNNNDVIMDFHAGSGTTAHAVLDINKEQDKNLKFILIEQMDYIKDITCKRVETVIEKNEQGNFIYAELKEIDNFKDCEIGRLNKNMQYLPIGDIDDESYKISEEEIAINKRFYGVEDE